MNVESIEIIGLYGYLDKNVTFNRDINLLVGINGSGKTSILNLINWMLIPSIPNLAVNEFERVSLVFNLKEERWSINAHQDDVALYVEILNLTTEQTFHPITVRFKTHPKNLTRNTAERNFYKSEYTSLVPDQFERETWNVISSLIPNPVVIGLDRTLYTEDGDKISLYEESESIYRKSNARRQASIPSPLRNVMDVASQRYANYKNKVLSLNQRLKDKIMLSSFDHSITEESLGELLKESEITVQHIEKLEKKVKDYFLENINDNKSTSNKMRRLERERTVEKIDVYFRNLKQVITEKHENPRKDLIYFINVTQFKKIGELIKEFESIESKSNELYSPLQDYLDAVNIFLRDSSKELYFNKERSELRYRIFDKDREVLESNRDIESLSSGEKQILILFTYIKFSERIGRVFIIDEPELSLHPKWQESFLDGIKSVMPPNTQLLFATHSPPIVGRHKKYCQSLLPY